MPWTPKHRPAHLLLLMALVPLAAVPAWAGSLAPDLEEALIGAERDELVPVVVLMEAFPLQSELLAEVRGLNRAHRRAHVVSTMKQLAGRSQRRVQELLTEERDEIGGVRVLWGINGVAVEATPRVIERLAALGTEPVKPDLATPQALRRQLEAEVAKWGQVIRAAGVKAN